MVLRRLSRCALAWLLFGVNVAAAQKCWSPEMASFYDREVQSRDYKLWVEVNHIARMPDVHPQDARGAGQGRRGLPPGRRRLLQFAGAARGVGARRRRPRRGDALRQRGRAQSARLGGDRDPGLRPLPAAALAPALRRGAAASAVTTWWCGQEQALGEVRAGLDGFALQPVFEPDPEPVEPALLAAEERASFEAELARHPERFVARERMAPSLAPCLAAEDASHGQGRVIAAPVVLRALVLWHVIEKPRVSISTRKC